MTRFLTRLCLFGCLLALFIGPAWALEDVRDRQLQSAAIADGDGLVLSLERFSSVSVDVTISGTATVTFEGSTLGGGWTGVGCIATNDVTGTPVLVTSTTGMYQCNVAAFAAFHAPISGCSACTVTVFARATTGSFAKRGGGGGGLTGWPTVSTTKVMTWQNSFANARRGEDGTGTGFAEYTDATLGPRYVCYVLGVENDCNYYRSLNPGKEGGFTDRNGTKIFTLTEAVGVGALTNVTLNAESSGNTITTTTKVSFAAVGCSGTSGTLLMDTNATLAPTATCVAGSTNTTLMQGYADYPDSASDTHMMTVFRLPADWTGAIDAVIYWKAAATSGDVVWMLQTLCRADAEIEDAAWNTTFNFPADTAKGTTLQLNTVTGTSITTTGCAAGELFYVNVVRNNATSGDTIAGVVSFKNVEFTLRRAQ